MKISHSGCFSINMRHFGPKLSQLLPLSASLIFAFGKSRFTTPLRHLTLPRLSMTPYEFSYTLYLVSKSQFCHFNTKFSEQIHVKCHFICLIFSSLCSKCMCKFTTYSSFCSTYFLCKSVFLNNYPHFCDTYGHEFFTY